MTKMEARYSCPVCLGATLEKVRLELPGTEGKKGSAPPLVLDHCPRCGGVWFEHGEVQQLRRVDPAELWTKIVKRSEAHRMQCHNCAALVARNETRCSTCGWNAQLDCPVCERKMDIVSHGDLRLDVCKRCKGVWFDHDELADVWEIEVNAMVQQKRGAIGDAGVGSLVLLDALTYDPFLTYYGLHAAGYAIGGAAEVLSRAPDAIANAPEAIAGLADAAGDVASSVFETIVDIISGLFN
jgi:Zn-finger nucleic acid-binding protein